MAVGLAAGDKAPIVSMLSTTEFTNMCIAAWPAGPAEFMTRNKRLGGERKQPLPAGKDLLTRAGGVVLSHRPSQAPRRGGGGAGAPLVKPGPQHGSWKGVLPLENS